MKRLLSLSFAAALFSACGGSGVSAPAVTLPAGATVIKAVPSLRFDAKSYGPAAAGEILIGYSNSDSVRHTLIIAKDGVKVPNFKLVAPQKGSNIAGTITLSAGTYTLLCDVPGHSDMKATLTVK